jgi:hypothetical protein
MGIGCGYWLVVGDMLVVCRWYSSGWKPKPDP